MPYLCSGNKRLIINQRFQGNNALNVIRSAFKNNGQGAILARCCCMTPCLYVIASTATGGLAGVLLNMRTFEGRNKTLSYEVLHPCRRTSRTDRCYHRHSRNQADLPKHCLYRDRADVMQYRCSLYSDQH